jgi:hypothetical protein
MEKLDRLVTERLPHQLLTPDRVGNLLAGLRDEDHATRLTVLKAKPRPMRLLTNSRKMLVKFFSRMPVPESDTLTPAAIVLRISAVIPQRWYSAQRLFQDGPTV